MTLELLQIDINGLYPSNSSLVDELKRLFNNNLNEMKPNSGVEEDDWQWNGVEVDPHLDEWIPMGRPVLKREKKQKKTLPSDCVFCKNNREPPEVFQSHILKDLNGKVRCPVLRKYECPICGAYGDKAHTIKYCPLNQGQVATMGSFKTLRTSTGKRKQQSKL